MDDVNYWLDIAHAEIGLRDVEYTKRYCGQFVGMQMLQHITIQDTGVLFFMIIDDWDGTKSLLESLFYIRPEDRGDFWMVRAYIKQVEVIAKANNCKTVRIGANIRYKDQSFMKMLNRFGYLNEVAVKVFE